MDDFDDARSAGMKWAIIEIEDLEGKIEGMCFAETFADITTRYPDALKTERIVFVKGKIDRKRETPSLLVNDVLPIEVALEKLTTNVGVKLDRTRHSTDTLAELRKLLDSHVGRNEFYIQVPTLDGKKLSMSVGKEKGVRISKTLIDDLSTLLGADSLMLAGEGSRRQRRLQQQALFKQEQVEEAAPDIEAPSDAMDEELVEVE